jgi:hypothetical protein
VAWHEGKLPSPAYNSSHFRDTTLVPFLNCLAIGALLATAVPPAHAQGTLYNNFGPGDTYQLSSGWALSATTPVAANPFTATGNTLRFDSVTLALTASGLPNQIDVWLMSDAGGLPDAIIKAFHFTNAMPPTDYQFHPPLVASSILHPLLEEGRTYWIAASVADYVTTSGIYAQWMWNPTGDTGPFAFREAGVNHWFVNPGGNARGAYRVKAVPEPNSSAVLLAGILGLTLYRWRGAAAERGDDEGETRRPSQPQASE